MAISKIIVELVQYNQKGERVSTGETGVVMTHDMVLTPDPTSQTGVRHQAVLGVCWENNRVPALSYHSPEELEWLSIPSLHDEDEDDEEIVDDDDEDEVAEDPAQFAGA